MFLFIFVHLGNQYRGFDNSDPVSRGKSILFVNLVDRTVIIVINELLFGE